LPGSKQLDLPQDFPEIDLPKAEISVVVFVNMFHRVLSRLRDQALKDGLETSSIDMLMGLCERVYDTGKEPV